MASERERLLEAMIRIVTDRGYDGTTVEDVVVLAGLPRSTFDEAFADKDDCFLAAYDALAELLLIRTAAAFGAQQRWPDRVRAGLSALLEHLADESEVARMAIVEVTGSIPGAQERYRRTIQRFTALLDEGREFATAGRELPLNTAYMAVGGAAAIIFEELHARRGGELRRLLPDLLFALLVPYVGPEMASAEMQATPRP